MSPLVPLAVLLVILTYLVHFYRRVSRYPRGPFPWPLVGNFFQLPVVDLHLHATKLGEKYGPVFTLWQPNPVVYILDYANINALSSLTVCCLNQNEFNAQETTMLTDLNGKGWKEERRRALQIFRDFGMGSNRMEEQVMTTVRSCIEHIKSLPDLNHVDLRWPIQLFVLNVINMTLFGYYYPPDDSDRCALHYLRHPCVIKELEVCKTRLSKWGPFTDPLVKFVQQVPWLLKFPIIYWYASGRYEHIRQHFITQLGEDVQKSLGHYDPSTEPQTFTQAYMQRTGSSYNFLNLLNVVTDFFNAGSETTTTTLRWACTYMVQHPEIQEKVRKEIHEHLGKNRWVTLKDRAALPYTTATIMESQRHANVVELNISHMTTRDTVCGKFHIPAGTEIQALCSTVLREDPHYKDPTAFRPERFLETDGISFKKDLVDRLVPFGMGKRQCAGESLARVEVFLGFVSILQHFRIKKPIDVPLNLKGTFGLVRLPPTNNFVIEVL